MDRDDPAARYSPWWGTLAFVVLAGLWLWGIEALPADAPGLRRTAGALLVLGLGGLLWWLLRLLRAEQALRRSTAQERDLMERYSPAGIAAAHHVAEVQSLHGL